VFFLFRVGLDVGDSLVESCLVLLGYQFELVLSLAHRLTPFELIQSSLSFGLLEICLLY
jgi:hypothetical protein